MQNKQQYLDGSRKANNICFQKSYMEHSLTILLGSSPVIHFLAESWQELALK